MNFDDGSAVRLTVARYYTPTGRSIQKSYLKGNKEYFKESDSRLSNGELFNKDSIKSPKVLKYKTPKGRIVYGGGGIVPDIFVPIETETKNQNSIYLLQSGIVSQFVFEQFDINKNAFKELSFEQLKNKIDGSDLYFNSFQKYIYSNGLEVKLDDKFLAKRYLLAQFSRQLFGDDLYYKILLEDDAMIKVVVNKK